MEEIPFIEQLPLDELVQQTNDGRLSVADFAYFEQLVQEADWKFSEFWSALRAYASGHMEEKSEDYLLLSAQKVRKMLGGADGLIRKYANLLEWAEQEPTAQTQGEIVVTMLRHYLLLMRSAAQGTYPAPVDPGTLKFWETKFYDARVQRRIHAFDSLREKLEQTFEGGLSPEKSLVKYTAGENVEDITASSIDYTLTGLLGPNYERLNALEKSVRQMREPSPSPPAKINKAVIQPVFSGEITYDPITNAYGGDFDMFTSLYFLEKGAKSREQQLAELKALGRAMSALWQRDGKPTTRVTYTISLFYANDDLRLKIMRKK